MNTLIASEWLAKTFSVLEDSATCQPSLSAASLRVTVMCQDKGATTMKFLVCFVLLIHGKYTTESVLKVFQPDVIWDAYIMPTQTV